MTLLPAVAAPRARNVYDNTHLDAYVVYFLSNSPDDSLGSTDTKTDEFQNPTRYTFYLHFLRQRTFRITKMGD